MKLKLDENLSRHLKTILCALQHDVTTAAEDGLLSRPDAAVATAACREHLQLNAFIRQSHALNPEP